MHGRRLPAQLADFTRQFQGAEKITRDRWLPGISPQLDGARRGGSDLRLFTPAPERGRPTFQNQGEGANQ